MRWPLFVGERMRALTALISGEANKQERPLMPSVFTSREGPPLGTWAELSIFRWTEGKKRPLPCWCEKYAVETENPS